MEIYLLGVLFSFIIMLIINLVAWYNGEYISDEDIFSSIVAVICSWVGVLVVLSMIICAIVDKLKEK